MKILAIEFSSNRRNAAVLSGQNALGAASETGGRNALALVERALAQAHIEREEIEMIAVGLGPGSYTGIRGAIALAQGWQLGRAVKLVGVSSSECLMAQVDRADPYAVVIDAQRDEFYVEWPGAPLRLAARPEVEELRATRQLIGPGISSIFQGAIDLDPDAATLGRIAAVRGDFVPGDKLEPIYLRATAFKKAAPSRLAP